MWHSHEPSSNAASYEDEWETRQGVDQGGDYIQYHQIDQLALHSEAQWTASWYSLSWSYKIRKI